MIEYALILSFVALILVSSLTLLGASLDSTFGNVSETLSGDNADSGKGNK